MASDGCNTLLPKEEEGSAADETKYVQSGLCIVHFNGQEKDDIDSGTEKQSAEKEIIRPDISCLELVERITPFWADEPQAWFARLEALFALSAPMTDHMKYCYVITRLDQESAKEVEDIILSPPQVDKYEKIKEVLVTRLSSSREKKIHKLIMEESIGNRKPSEMLEHLQRIAGSVVPKNLIKAVWFRSMPKKIQNIIGVRDDTTLENLAVLADCIYNMENDSGVESQDNQMKVLVKKVDELTQQVRELKLQVNKRLISSSRNFLPVNCWYHQNFAERAIKCISPCNFNATF